MGQFLLPLTLRVLAARAIFPCTIVNQPSPREALKVAAVVFRGTVTKTEALPTHPEVRGRQRFAVALRVTEYWKGDRGQTVTCMTLLQARTVWVQGCKPGKNT